MEKAKAKGWDIGEILRVRLKLSELRRNLAKLRMDNFKRQMELPGRRRERGW